MALGPRQQLVVGRADSARIRKEFGYVVQQWNHARWLSTGNKYALEAVGQLEIDTSPGGALAHRQLARYIAASTLMHCVDGWSYAARALEAMLSGDTHAATHLAYYAELRAAMSLLASGGIGVFDDRHFVVTKNGSCERVNGRTHGFAWDALSHWATRPDSSKLVLEAIRPGGIPLEKWLPHFPAAPGTGVQAKLVASWLLEWGIDLQTFVEDRDARNRSSYRPTALPQARRIDFSRSLQFMEGFWSSFEPSALHPFRILDRYLLRRSMGQAFRASKGVSPRRAPRAYMKFVKVLLHQVGPGDLTPAAWKDFLDLTTPKEDSPLITAAEGREPKDSPLHHVGVIARAAMLLRVATGASRSLLAVIPPADITNLRFWWHGFGEDRGYWEASSIPSLLSDLWTDIQGAVNESELWRTSSGSRHGFFMAKSLEARALSTCERIPLWSLGV